MIRFIQICFVLLLGAAMVAGYSLAGSGESRLSLGPDIAATKPSADGLESAVFAGGCFWCLESEFRAQPGVIYTESGYTGGTLENPTYQQVIGADTGHAEVVRIWFDPSITDYRTLAVFFFTKAHDPTQLNRQGVDVGPQYRSAVFPETEERRAMIKELIAEVDATDAWRDPIVTTIEPAAAFYRAEEYHQQYYEKYHDRTGRDHIRVILKGK